MPYFFIDILLCLCLLSGYRISWEEFNRTNTRVTHYLPSVTLEYRVTGLTALTTYTIEVAAMTSKGQGLLSSSTISSGVPPGQFGDAPYDAKKWMDGRPCGCFFFSHLNFILTIFRYKIFSTVYF